MTIADVDFILKLLATDTDTKFLARPKIMTINNEPAIIKVSANQAIGTNNTSVSTTGQSISTAERAETGVILKVTPQVNDRGDIFMFIEPSVSRTVPSGLSAAFLDPSYRTSASTVMIRDMETVVVAGLIQTNNTKTLRKVPFLADIPIIGEPFKSRSKQLDDTELMIFVTPHIVTRRDAEYITPSAMSNRDYMVERALENYSENAGSNNKNGKQFTIPKEAVLKREDMVNKTMQKYSGAPSAANIVQHK
jgi:type II secretory pathway component GspD/PulD (secretin)